MPHQIPRPPRREDERQCFRDLLDNPEAADRPEPAGSGTARCGCSLATGQPPGAVPGDRSAAPAISQPAAPSQAPVDIDRLLGQQASGVQLATDGQSRHVLRFEVAQGDLRGTQLTVSSDGGVVSASAVAPSADLTIRLEQALEAARCSLESRGIDISAMDVRAGGDESERRATPESPTHDDDHEPASRDRPRGPNQAPRSAPASGVDYFV